MPPRARASSGWSVLAVAAAALHLALMAACAGQTDSGDGGDTRVRTDDVVVLTDRSDGELDSRGDSLARGDAGLEDAHRDDADSHDVETDTRGNTACCCLEGDRIALAQGPGDVCPTPYRYAEGETCYVSECGGWCDPPCRAACQGPAQDSGCPPDWSYDEASGFCIPGDCEADAWLEGACRTDEVTIHATIAPRDPETGERACPEGHTAYGVDLGATVLVCLDVPDILPYRGLFATEDGGRCWRRADVADPIGALYAGTHQAPLRMLRSGAFPALVMVVFPWGPILLSRDWGASFHRLGTMGCSAGSVSPSGRWAYLICGEDVRRISLPYGEPDEPIAVGGSHDLRLDVIAVSDSLAYVSGRFAGAGGWRSVVAVDGERGVCRFAGPLSESVRLGETFAVPQDPADPPLLAVDGGADGARLYRYDAEEDRWNEDLDASLPSRTVRYVPGRRGHLLAGQHRSTDGGLSWESVAEASHGDQLAYLAMRLGDRVCSDEGTCDSWTMLPGSGGVNVVAPSFVWYRGDEASTRYMPATSNLPFVEVVPGMEFAGPVGLTPWSLLALGDGRAVISIGERVPTM